MYAIVYRPNILKIILSVIIVCIYVAGVYYFINFYFIHSTIIFILVVAISLLLILRAIGIFLMYPGSFRYLTAQVQKKQNDNLLCNIHHSLNKIQEITNKIATQQIVRLKGTYYQLYATNIMKTIQLQLNTLRKCQNSSTNKQQLILRFQQLIQQLNSSVFVQGKNSSQSGSSQRQFMMDSQITQQYDHSKFSLSMIFNQPKYIHKINDGIQYNKLQQKSIKIMNICRKIWELCCTIATIPTHDTKKNIKKTNNFQSTQQMTNPNLSQQQKPIQIDKCEAASWHLFQQKLFTIDSYFAYWDNLFEYTQLMVPVGHGNFIQCAIIHSQKITETRDYQKIRQKTRKYPGILFSNPNGAIFQQLVLYSSYINFYLKWGLQVVLWNYRGYAKSTGFSTISHAVADIQKVYKYISKEHIINIQVLHGYSIGGLCSIKLAHKLNKKSEKPIKILIADRTFSRIDRVPQGLIKQKNILMRILKKISSPIVKLLFISQCFDNSQIFLDSDCKKVIIYDIFDQIITKQASLKHGIQNYTLQQGYKIGHGKQENLYFKYQQLKINLNLFSTAICQIYKKDKTICQKITTIMSDTDGGGSSLFLKFGSRKTQNNKQLSLHKVKAISQSYFIGIFLYGPKLCLPNFADDLKKQQWIEKRIKNKIQLLTKYKQKMQNNQNQICIQQITDIITTITFVKQNLKIQYREQKQKIFGHLIVSEVGHNRQLKKQFIHFEEIFGKIYKQHQNKLQKINNRMFEE